MARAPRSATSEIKRWGKVIKQTPAVKAAKRATRSAKPAKPAPIKYASFLGRGRG